ncbi:hypothetical protein EXIGLDRAFT_784223 [Exidia glandulosa HHB12029]|uniref:CBM1 domain-containing protein n=1 Tax=Exidia glandulosa HHB12029 TaxID=1314781 RepID=A0A166MLG5_EXIGL|nr:hypothetical protein EXIGLDRAFT_784223 [Exidia glandulosa HHB12029]
MQLKLQIVAVAVTLVATAFASPAPGPAPQPGCIIVSWPDTCPAGMLACNGAGSITLCCPGSC